MAGKTIKVVEYQTLRVGEVISDAPFTEAHWQSLAAFAERHGEKYFQLRRDGVRFLHYVGVLQAGNLTIEVLPKIGQPTPTDVRRVLLDLLRACGYLTPLPVGCALLRERPGNLWERYLSEFFIQIEQMLQRGLLRDYRPEVANQSALRGKLLLRKQLQHNLVHPERFYTQIAAYDADHLYNRLLRQALSLLTEIPWLSPVWQGRARQLLRQMPELTPLRPPFPNFEELPLNRRLQPYQSALRTALLILQQLQPDLRAGRLPALAFLLDMNALFEEYLFQQLYKVADAHLTVQRQVRQPFWERRYLQPDILLTVNGQRTVLDAKWKYLNSAAPDIADLRQMFTYCRYFQAVRSVLVYPRASGAEDLPPTPFQPAGDAEEPCSCQVVFVELVRDGALNIRLGRELIEKIRL